MFVGRLNRPLTSFAAIIMTATILVDPFIQQLVQYTEYSTNITSAFIYAKLPRTNFYNPIPFHVINDLIPRADEAIALTSGLFGQPADVEFDCSSSNCTFIQEFSTVDWCSECTDVSHSLTFSQNFIPNSVCNVISSLPDGSSITSWADLSGTRHFLSMDFLSTCNDDITFIIASSDYLNETAPNTTTKICRNYMYSMTSNNWTCQGYGATSCSFGPCVRTYNASVDNGRLDREIIVNSNALRHTDLQYYVAPGTNDDHKSSVVTSIDTQYISTDERNKLRDHGYDVDSSS